MNETVKEYLWRTEKIDCYPAGNNSNSNLLPCRVLRDLDRMGDVVRNQQLPLKRSDSQGQTPNCFLDRGRKAAGRISTLLCGSERPEDGMEHEVRANSTRGEIARRSHGDCSSEHRQAGAVVPFTGDYN